MHQEQAGGNENGPREDHGGHNDAENLGVKDDDTSPSSLGKGRPGVGNGGVAKAANYCRLNLAIERSVKGDDGVLVLGEKRSLDTDENDAGRDNDYNPQHSAEEEVHSRLDHVSDFVFGEVARKAASAPAERGRVKADQAGQQEGDKLVHLGSSPVDDKRLPSSIKGALEGGQTAPELSGGRVRDDNVNPSSGVLNHDQGCQQLGKGPGREPREEGGDNAAEHILDQKTHETTEVGSEAAIRSEKAVDGAKRRGHSSRGAVGRLGAASGGLFVLISVARKRLIGRGVFVFNDGEDGVDVEQGVLDLYGVSGI